MTKSEYLIPRKSFNTYLRWLIPAAPSKLWKFLFGKWILIPRGWLAGFFADWFEKELNYNDEMGVCYFLIVEKP